MVRIALGAVILLAGVLYLTALGTAPVNIGVDEARFAIRAQSIASTARDIDGARLPLFFHITDPVHPFNGSDTWWQPSLFYLTAAVFRVMPFTEWSTRLPVALLAILNVCLIYAVGRGLFANAWYAVVAASILTLTPAHFIFGRQAQDYFCMLPVALAWLWCLSAYLETGAAWLPPVTGALLGLGLYCHISSWVVMPLYLAVTLAAFALSRQPIWASIQLAAGFVAPLLVLLPWLWFHPGLLHDMFTNYRVSSEARWIERIDIYWDYFNPSYLFFSGGSSPMFATRRAGVFLLAAAVLLPCGIWNLLKQKASIARAAVVIAFIAAPLPIVLALPQDPKYYTPRDLLAVPCAALICAAGVEWLMARGRAWRLVAVVLMLAVPVQFVSFARYYFTDYQIWSAAKFDPLSLRGVAAVVIARDEAARVPAVYLSEDFGESQGEQWVFHLLRRSRRDLWERSRHFDTARVRPDDIAPGSLLVLDARNPRLDQLRRADWCRSVQIVNDANGSPAAAILGRN